MSLLECEVCGETPKKNSIVCSDKCQATRLKMFELDRKYFPTNGCDNCWGDLHGGCSSQCTREFAQSREFMQDLWSLIGVIYPPKSTPLKDSK